MQAQQRYVAMIGLALQVVAIYLAFCLVCLVANILLLRWYAARDKERYYAVMTNHAITIRDGQDVLEKPMLQLVRQSLYKAGYKIIFIPVLFFMAMVGVALLVCNERE